MKKKIVFGLILVIAIALVIWGIVSGGAFGGGTAKASRYQAVFLTNNQVYFGKVAGLSSQFITLRDIYYLQVNPGAQQPPDITRGDISLIKLGSELHGPTDEMKINRDQVLLVETLREDSQVTQAIERFKTGQQTQ